MILTDNETKVDLLNNEAIATTIVSLLRERPDRPITVGVHGDWGAGKSSILEMIESNLAGDKDVLCLKFNSWRFQGFEDSKIALIEGIVTGLLESRPFLTRSTAVVKNIFRRIDWLKVAKKAGGLAMTAFTGVPTPDMVSGLLGMVQGVATDPTNLLSSEKLAEAATQFQAVIKEGPSNTVPEEVKEFRAAFEQLLKEAGVRQLVVLIDDLDRCLPETAIETLEAIRLFVFIASTAFVIAADEGMIEYAVRRHFPDYVETAGQREYARNYLEKLIQVPFSIPSLGEVETRIYVTLLLTGAELGESDPAYLELIKVAKERLARPWESSPLDTDTIKKTLGDKAPKATGALLLSDQLGPILANGTKGNPRQIKRFLNALLLRKQTAAVRGYGDEIKLPILAKLMLAERFVPTLFEQIATIAVLDPRGRCAELAEIEAKPHVEASRQPPKKAEPGEVVVTMKGPGEGPMVSQWRLSPAILSWAEIHPPLAEIDLRAYLFTTKDKKNYFRPGVLLGPLAELASKLLGPKMIVQTLEQEVGRLALPEVEALFDAVRSSVMGGDSFNTQPQGIEGLLLLVRVHPSLQGRLLDFLSMLPIARLGPWAVVGFQGILKDPESLSRFDVQLENWAKSMDNNALRISAETVLKAKKGGR